MVDRGFELCPVLAYSVVDRGFKLFPVKPKNKKLVFAASILSIYVKELDNPSE